VFPRFASRPRGEAAATPESARPGQPAAPTPGEIKAIEEGARAAGFEAGRREGRAQAHTEWARRIEAGGHTLEEAATRLLGARAELAAEVERQWPRLLFDLARKVLSQELGVSQTAAQTVIRGICERLAGCERPVTVRLAPDAVPGVESWLHAADGAGAAGSGVRVEPDPKLGPGDFILETNDGFLDGRVESQLDEAWRLVTELPRR
jgi:flagellar assembly protein FliH